MVVSIIITEESFEVSPRASQGSRKDTSHARRTLLFQSTPSVQLVAWLKKGKGEL
eukprot:gene28608-34536_t